MFSFFKFHRKKPIDANKMRQVGCNGKASKKLPKNVNDLDISYRMLVRELGKL